MRVKMILDLISRTGPGAKATARDLKGVKDAANSLKGVGAGDKIASDLARIAPASAKAESSLRRLKAAYTGMFTARAGRGPADGALEGAGTPQRRTGGAAAAAASAFPGIRSTLGAYVGARALTKSVKDYAEAERAITRIGVTANASKEELAGVGETAFKVAQEVAMPYAKVVQGLEVLVAQGRSLKDAMAFLPAVARTASAAGAEVDDIAKTADSVSSNFKIAGDQMQSAFDIMAAGGKAGQFELKDMARYLPSLGPAAAAAGFQGAEGLRDLVSMLQVMRKGSGTAEEAAASMQNVLQKMMSEETAKRFKKFGVDLPKAMDKAKAEGRNLVEVFEELTATAIKGDLSKIPQLINDMEFARGIRSVMAYRGEWQKMSKAIGTTAAGTVANDLSKITDNVQARLDRLTNSFTRRMQQIGALVSDIVVPIDKKVDEITAGKNPIANAINDRAGLVNANHIAREEMRTGESRPYDAETRGRVDARKELLTRQAIDDKLAKLGQDIAAKEAELNGLAQRTQGAGKVRQDALLGPGRKAVEALSAERDALVALVKARDDANASLTDAEAARKKLDTRFSRPDETPGPITPGLKSFGIGPQGQVEREVKAPLPPTRPAVMPNIVPMLKNLTDMYQPLNEAGQEAATRWRNGFIENFDVDLGPMGRTFAERLAAGATSGTGSVISAAKGLNDALEDAAGADLSSAGQKAGESYAAGLLRSAPAVKAAAQALAAQARSAANNGVAAGTTPRRALSGALHDGVD